MPTYAIRQDHIALLACLFPFHSLLQILGAICLLHCFFLFFLSFPLLDLRTSYRSSIPGASTTSCPSERYNTVRTCKPRASGRWPLGLGNQCLVQSNAHQQPAKPSQTSFKEIVYVNIQPGETHDHLFLQQWLLRH